MPEDRRFQERTWQWATTPDDNGDAPIDGHLRPVSPGLNWRPRVLERLEDTELWPNVEFIVFVQNMQLDSSGMGGCSMAVAGPGYTWTAETIEDMKKNPMKYHIGDLPSQRMYPQWYISRAAHLKRKGVGG